jgi:hypothetical protein
MSHKKRHGDDYAPALFPFLAVLLCTIGALVLILAITVTNSHASARREAQAQVVEVQDAVDIAQVVSEEMEAYRIKLTQELESKRRALERIEDHAARLRQELDELIDRSESIEEHVEQTEDKRKEQIDQIASIKSEIEAKKKELADEIDKQKQQKPAFAVIPYVGPNGTSRRPVYLECCKDGVIVQPEGLLISNEELKPPFGPGNPVDSALRVLRVAYQKRDTTFGITQPPYPLLLVRPDGIQSYALARAAMGSWDDQFGYELIEADMKLAFPESPPGLREQLAAALDLARQRHAAMVMSVPQRLRQAQDWDDDNNWGAAGDSNSGSGSGRSGRGSSQSGSDRSSPTIEMPNAVGSKWEVIRELAPGQVVGTGAQQSGSQGSSNDPARSQANNGAPGMGYGPNNPNLQPMNKFSGGQLQGQYTVGSGTLQPLDGSSPFLANNAGNSSGGNSNNANPGNPSAETAVASNASDANVADSKGNNQTAGNNPNAGNANASSSNAAAGTPGGTSPSSGSLTSSGTLGNGNAQPTDSRANAFSSGSANAAGTSSLQSMSGSASTANDPSQPQTPNISMNFNQSSSEPPKDAKQNNAARHVSADGDLKPISVGAGRGWAASRAEGKATPVSRPINIIALSDRWLMRSESGGMNMEATITMEKGPQDAGAQLATAIRKRVDSWGLSVTGGYWRPTLTIEAASDASLSVARLQRLLEGSGVEIQTVPLHLPNRK